MAGAHVEAVSVDGSQRISNMTNGSGAYVLSLQPRFWYKITASSGSLKHTVLPVYLPEEGNRTCEYNINLSRTSTIEGSPTTDSTFKGKGFYITAAPANGDEPLTAVTGEDGDYSLTVEPGIYYTVTARSYDPGGTATGVALYYRNSIECAKVRPGEGETILLDYYGRTPFLIQPSLIVNGTVGPDGRKVDPPARVPTSPVPASGRVYRGNYSVKGAHVEAISIDGTDRVSAMTNDTGIYVLMLEPGVMYRARATYKGIEHSIWPLSHSQYALDRRNDIQLTPKLRSSITIYYQQGYQDEGKRVLIGAYPAAGGEPVWTLTDGPGNYTLDVEPGVKYDIVGKCYDAFGQDCHVNIDYPQDGPDAGIIVGPGETRIADLRVFFVHPPKFISIWRDPVTGSGYPFKSPVPVTVTGHVFIEGKPVKGASVTAIMSGTSESPVSTIADDNGTYVLNLSSRRQYELTATWGGRDHTVWPVYVQDNMTGIYDIQLAQRPASTISGIHDPDQSWPVLQGNIITAVPVPGGVPVIAVTGPDGSYSLDVKPFTFYDISGKSRGTDGEYHNLRFYYRTGISCKGFMLRESETALIDYHVD